MEFVTVDEAGLLIVEYDGPALDLVALGTLELQLQSIIDDAVELSLEASDVLYVVSRYGSRWDRPSKLLRFQDRIVRAQIRSASTGSFRQELQFALLAVLADPNVRGVLQGLGSNIVYAILRSGVRSLRGVRRRGNAVEPLPMPPAFPSLDVGAKVRDIVRALASSANGQRVALRIRHQRGEESLEVELEIGQQDGGDR